MTLKLKTPLIACIWLLAISVSAQMRSPRTILLSNWQFSKDAQNWEEVTIPHSCNAIDGHSPNYYRGRAYYKRTLTLTSKQASLPHFLQLDGAAQEGDVYVNGFLLTRHMGGYTAFTVNMTPYLHKGENEIKIMCDNHENVNLIPVSSDFNKNNGLHNPAYLLEMNEVYLSPSTYGPYRLQVSTPQVSAETASTNIVTLLANSSARNQKIQIEVILKDEQGNICFKNTEKEVLKAGENKNYNYNFNIGKPHLWNGVKDPYLYNLTLSIKDNKGHLLDEASTKVGYRFYKMDKDKGFFLNGHSYPLRGVSIHQDMEDKASAVSDADLEKDYEIVHELGANFVRLAHYPHRDLAFRICDSLGIIVQTEIPWVNVCGEFASKEYFATIQKQMTEMIHNLYNHPSIVFWGMWNEVASWGNKPELQGKIDFKKLLDNTKKVHDLAKALDPYRYVGLTDCSVFKKEYEKLTADYYSENRYNGWYYNTFKFNVFGEQMRDIHKRMGICNVAEYGGGCNPFCHTLDSTLMANRKDDTRHYEEYANLIHESHVKQIMEMPFLNFTSLWIMFDFPVAARQEGFMDSDDGIQFTENPYRKYTNDKGLVTRNRKTKKDVFYLYKSWWNKDVTTVYITSKRLKTYPANTPLSVKVYSNAKTLTLYLNGKAVQTLQNSGEATGLIWTFKGLKHETNKDTFKVVAQDGTTDEVVWNF